MTRLAVTKARTELSEMVNRVAYRGERVVLERRGKDVAAIVPIGDLELLEKLEDARDAAAARQALAETKKKREKPIPWKKARKDLGL